jgi:hypothetical protein
MQAKTVCTIIEVLKEARTITKNNTNASKNINDKIEYIVDVHTKAMNATKSGKKPAIKQQSSFLRTYKVNL